MKNQVSEHSKKLRIKTSTEWQKRKVAEGGYRLTVLVDDKEEAKFARENIPNKRELFIGIIRNLMNGKTMKWEG